MRRVKNVEVKRAAQVSIVSSGLKFLQRYMTVMIATQLREDIKKLLNYTLQVGGLHCI